MSEGLRGRQKLVVGLAGLTRAASGGMLGTALVVYVGRAGSPLAVSMLATVFFLSTTVFAPLWGVLGDLTGRRKALLVAVSLCASLGTAAFLLVGTVWGWVALRGVYAVFAVGFGPLMLSLVGALGGAAHRGRSVGFFKSASALGDVGAQALVGVLLGALAPSELYLFVAAVGLLGTVVLVAVEDPAPQTPERPLRARTALRDLRERALPDAAERRTLRETGLSTLYVGLALRHVAVKGVGSLVPIYLVAQVGFSTVTMGLLLTLGPATQLLAQPVVGRVADAGHRKRLVVVGIAASGGYALLLAGATLPADGELRLLAAGLSFVVVAAAFAAMDMGTIAIIGDAVPASRESAFLGLRATATGVGGVVGPTLVGVVAVLVGYPAAFAAVSVFAFAAALLVRRALVEPATVSERPDVAPPVETALGIERPVKGDD